MDKEQLQEAQKGLTDMLLPAVTKEVMKNVKKELPDLMPQQVEMVGSEDKLKKLQDEAVEYTKSIASGRKAVYANETTATEGAELAPEYYSSEIIRIAESYGLARQKCRRVPLPGKKINWGTIDAGVTAEKVAEGIHIPAKKPTTGQEYMEPEKLGLIIPVAKDLLEDTNIDLVNLLNVLSAEAFAKKEDAMLLGTSLSSAGEGIMKKSGVPVKTIVGTAFVDATFDEFLDLQDLVDDEVADDMEYVFSRYMFNRLRSKKHSIGSDQIGYTWGNPSFTPPDLWGLPYNVHRSMPKLADSAADTAFAILADFRYAFFGDRRMYMIERSDVATIKGTDGATSIDLWAQDMVGFKFTEKIDIEIMEAAKAFAIMKTAAAGS